MTRVTVAVRVVVQVQARRDLAAPAGSADHQKGHPMDLGYGGIYHPDPSRRAQNRRIREAEINALRAAGRVSDINADIAGRQEAADRASRVAEVSRRMAAAVTAIEESSVGSRDEWLARLGQVTPTAPSAADDLTDLRADVDRFARWMAIFADVRGAGLPIVELSPRWADAPDVSGVRDWPERRRNDARQAEAISEALSELISVVRGLEATRRDTTT
jgi:hypothetical protein